MTLSGMVLIPFIGFSKSGKTASIESIIRYFTAYQMQCIALKHIHLDNFTIDQPGKNTHRYSQAGSKTVVAQSANESAVVFNWQVDPVRLIKSIQSIGLEEGKFLHEKPFIVMLEGFRDLGDKKILCVKSFDEIAAQIDPAVEIIAGAICQSAEDMEKAARVYKKPVVDLVTEPEKILSLFQILP